MKKQMTAKSSNDRRKFLVAAAKYSAAMAALGLSQGRPALGAVGQLSGVEKARYDLLQNAIQTRDMANAIERYGSAAA